MARNPPLNSNAEPDISRVISSHAKCTSCEIAGREAALRVPRTWSGRWRRRCGRCAVEWALGCSDCCLTTRSARPLCMVAEGGWLLMRIA
jgi:hypothetical protein